MTSMKTFKTPPPPVHLRLKFFHPLNLGRPILNDPLPSLTNYGTTTAPCVNKQNQNKNKTMSHHIQIDHAPRVLLLDLAHKQCNDIIER